MSLRGTSRGLTCTACGNIGDVTLFYSSTLGCDVAICWKATLLVMALPRDCHVVTRSVTPRKDTNRRSKYVTYVYCKGDIIHLPTPYPCLKNVMENRSLRRKTMTIKKIAEILNAEFICCEEFADREVYTACGSDMMSDLNKSSRCLTSTKSPKTTPLPTCAPLWKT